MIGAAVTLLLTKFIDAVQHCFWAYSLFSPPRILSLIWRPLLATTAMCGYLAYARGGNTIVCITMGTAIYVLTLLALSLWSEGGFQGLRAKYLLDERFS
jgi:tryptophan-rich sensory protein